MLQPISPSRDAAALDTTTRESDVPPGARTFGADAAIAKPFTVAELLAVVRETLGEASPTP